MANSELCSDHGQRRSCGLRRKPGRRGYSMQGPYKRQQPSRGVEPNIVMGDGTGAFAPLHAAWKTLEPSYLSLALSPLKPLTSPRAFRARELLTSSFISYLEDNGPETASAFIREAHAHNVSHGFTTEDLARFEIGHSQAVIGSTAPTAWWLLWHVYSDPMLLHEVRAELEGLAVDAPDPLGDKTRNLDLSLLLHATVLQSVLKETLRVRTISPAVRFCLEDHLLEGKYLLKKGALVIVPQPLHHSSTSVWGEDADQFDPRRFMPSRKGAKGEKGYDHAAFRAFGGGHTLCPDRHFSAAEMVAFVAMMVLRFDMVPTKGGKWAAPTCKKTPMVASLQIPDEDVEVEVRTRDNGRGRWQFVGPGEGKEMGISSV
ncbi:cytochrome P450 [Xylaria telfairii]|nr:cytochrome P450 [Xylaria telfairii]